MSIKIPIKLVGDDVFEIAIETTLYTIRSRWNTREGSWYLDIYDVDKISLVRSLKVLPLTNLLYQYVDTKLPRETVLIVTDNKPEEYQGRVLFTDINNRIQVLLLSYQEIIDAIS